MKDRLLCLLSPFSIFTRQLEGSAAGTGVAKAAAEKASNDPETEAILTYQTALSFQFIVFVSFFSALAHPIRTEPAV